VKTVRAGRLRHWVRFETYRVELDSDGAQVEAWLPAFAVNTRMPCEVLPISARELLAAAAVQSKVTHRIKVRYREEFIRNAYKMRGVYRGVEYNIEGTIPDPDSGVRFLVLLASSGLSPGN
jgi:SPP1 family predicted phage head-tail adaptor